MKKLLIATSSFGVDQKVLKKLKKKFQIITNKSGKKLNILSLSKLIKNVDYVIAGTEMYNEEVLRKAKNLKIIFRFGKGIDNIDIKICNKFKIKIKKIKVDLSTSVAELSFSLILNLIKKVNFFDTSLKKKSGQKRLTTY